MPTLIDDSAFDSIERRVRLVALLNASKRAALTPIPILRLHTFAYLANVLAPVWDMPSLDGKVLKRRGGPFYPALQHDLDRLVGLGVVKISGLGHVKSDDGRWRLEGSYELTNEIAKPIVECVTILNPYLNEFITELAYALSALPESDFDLAMTEDATYSDPIVSAGNIVDFGEWKRINSSFNAAQVFQDVVPPNIRVTPGEKIHFYLRHLHARLHAGE